AVIGGDVARQTKRLGNALLIAFGILRPVAGAGRGVDTDDAVGPNAKLAQAFGDAAALADLGEEVGAVRVAAHRGAAASAAPDRRDHRADHQAARSHLVGKAFQVI